MCVSSFHFIHIIDICLLFSYIWLSLSNNMVMHVHISCLCTSKFVFVNQCVHMCVLYYDWMFKKSEFDWFLWWKMLTCEEYDTQIQVRINVVSSLKKRRKKVATSYFFHLYSFRSNWLYKVVCPQKSLLLHYCTLPRSKQNLPNENQRLTNHLSSTQKNFSKLLNFILCFAKYNQWHLKNTQRNHSWDVWPPLM